MAGHNHIGPKSESPKNTSYPGSTKDVSGFTSIHPGAETVHRIHLG